MIEQRTKFQVRKVLSTTLFLEFLMDVDDIEEFSKLVWS